MPSNRKRWRAILEGLWWRRVWWCLLLGYTTVLYVGTHIPLAVMPPLPQGSDKGLHFGAYFGLGLLVGARPFVTRRTLSLAVVGIWVWGMFDELTQLLVNRHADVADWLSDAIGALIGVVLSASVMRVIMVPRERAERGTHA
jgi:VanZ family protein